MRGFSLVELLVAMAMFLIVAGAAFSLFDQHVSLATRQQNLSGVNIGLRNAMSQLEADLAGAGQNLLSSVPSAGQPFSLGVIINNNVPGTAAACAPNTADWSYPVPSACFDSLTIINTKSCPVLDIDDPGNSQESLSTSSIMWGNDPNNPGNGATLANDASCFKNGDEVLVVQLPTSWTATGPMRQRPIQLLHGRRHAHQGRAGIRQQNPAPAQPDRSKQRSPRNHLQRVWWNQLCEGERPEHRF